MVGRQYGVVVGLGEAISKFNPIFNTFRNFVRNRN
jgi:hypothetical protein